VIYKLRKESVKREKRMGETRARGVYLYLFGAIIGLIVQSVPIDNVRQCVNLLFWSLFGCQRGQIF
jgi:hypothetical protein